MLWKDGDGLRFVSGEICSEICVVALHPEMGVRRQDDMTIDPQLSAVKLAACQPVLVGASEGSWVCWVDGACGMYAPIISVRGCTFSLMKRWRCWMETAHVGGAGVVSGLAGSSGPRATVDMRYMVWCGRGFACMNAWWRWWLVAGG